jgi:hypothetical protein
MGLTGSKTEYLSQITTVVGAVREAPGRSVRIAMGAYSFHGLGSAGISMEVPSGSIRKSGGEPGKGAGGPSSTKHAICKSREGRLAPSEKPTSRHLGLASSPKLRRHGFRQILI